MIRNANVVVIGGAGFLGSHLVEHLVEDRDCRVIVLDNLISGHFKYIPEGVKFIWHDIRDDEHELTRILKAERAEFVFNYAAEPYIPECFERPAHFFDINATAVLKVLNACQAANIRGLLQMSSAEIYGDITGRISEDAPIVPHSTYGVSKVAADGLVQVRWREAQVPAIALRQFNCVGERETHEYVVPEIISQLAADMIETGVKEAGCHGFIPSNNSVRIALGNNSVRDFLYAGDAVRSAVELLENGDFGEVYNLGSERGVHIYELAHMIAGLMGFDELEIETDKERERPWEIWHLESNNKKIHSKIDYRPAVHLEDALHKTISYFLANGKRWDIKRVTARTA